MKLYRSIEFSKLIFLLSEEYQFLWEEYQNRRDELSVNGRLHRNWWMNKEFEKERREMVSAVIRLAHEAFFKKSMEFNAMSGGRFNPEKSFGVLYSANNPTVAALEVLYHKFIDLLPAYSGMQSSKDTIQSALDIDIPDELEVMIVAFELEIEGSGSLLRVNDRHEELRQICQSIGFKRYTEVTFDREFIFGNDYEISRHLGTYIHSKDQDGFFVPSARISFDTQDELELRNAIIFEHKIEKLSPKLTGCFQELRCSVDLTRSDFDGMDVIVSAQGQSSRKVVFKLQPMPPKKGAHPQIIQYLPNTLVNKGRSRLVHIQKYFVPRKRDEVS